MRGKRRTFTKRSTKSNTIKNFNVLDNFARDYKKVKKAEAQMFSRLVSDLTKILVLEPTKAALTPCDRANNRVNASFDRLVNQLGNMVGKIYLRDDYHGSTEHNNDQDKLQEKLENLETQKRKRDEECANEDSG